MTAHVGEWLPIEVVCRAKVREALDCAVLDWSRDWFATQRLQATRFRPLAQRLRMQVEGDIWRAYRGPVAIAVTDAAATRLASWALDAPLDRLELGVRDAAVVEALQHALLDDLTARVEALLGVPDTAARPAPAERRLGGDGLEAAVTDASGALVASIAVPLEAILPFARTTLPPAQPSTTAVAALGSALASTGVTIEATLGRAEIGVTDLRRLAKGDVLVLDREIEAGVRLGLAGSGHALGAARLGEAGGRLTLTLESDQQEQNR